MGGIPMAMIERTIGLMDALVGAERRLSGTASRTRSGVSGSWVCGDRLLVGFLASVALVSLPFLEQVTSKRDDTPLITASVLTVLIAAAALSRHRWPALAAVGASIGLGVYLASDAPYGPVFGLVTLTLYSAGRWLRLPRAAGVGMFAFVALCPHLVTNEAALPAGWGMLPLAAWVILPVTLGAARRSVVAASIREREAESRRAVAAERLRLAQEVHDVVGHGLAAISMQADIGLHVAAGSPEHAMAALEEISRAGNLALEDLRETLRTIHPEGQGTAPRPTPGLARVPELRDRLAAAGIDLCLRVEGEQAPLSAAADITAYRVLQEALTNVVRHSTSPGATVTIRHRSDVVVLRVVNSAAAQVLRGRESDGLGITGMRRRVSAHGGTLVLRRSDTAFEVTATIPRAATREERR